MPTENASNLVWLCGERYNVEYLFDRSTGRVLRKEVRDRETGPAAGITQRCGRRFVSVFVSGAGDVQLQIGKQRLPLDGSTRAIHRRRLLGFVSSLRVWRDGQAPVTVRDVSLMRPIMAVIDPTHDELDAWAADHLWIVADLVNRPDNRRAFVEHRNAPGE